MSDVLISDLPAAAPLSINDLIEIEQGVSPSNTSAKTTLGAALALIGGMSVGTKTASFVLGLADPDWIEVDVATANTVTIPTNATAAFPIGTQRTIRQFGAGKTSFSAAVGVTINSDETLNLRKRYSVATIVKVGTDLWALVGSLEASP